MANTHEIVRELNRLEGILSEAESTGKMLIESECGNDENPYPIFFTYDELIKEINEGSWHHCNWFLKDKNEIKKEINEVIKILQERIMRL